MSQSNDNDTHGSDRSGLYQKYEVRKDGEPVEDCFVLEPADDHAARIALIAYANTTDDEELADDLWDWLWELREEDGDRDE